MTIVTTDEPEFSFGVGRWGWLIDSSIKIATELLEFDYSKYAELPPTGKQVGFSKKKKVFSQTSNGYTKLQTSKYRRARKPCRCYYNKPRVRFRR